MLPFRPSIHLTQNWCIPSEAVTIHEFFEYNRQMQKECIGFLRSREVKCSLMHVPFHFMWMCSAVAAATIVT